MPKRSSEEDIKEEGNLNFNFGSEKKDIDEKEESVINSANDEGLDSVKIYRGSDRTFGQLIEEEEEGARGRGEGGSGRGEGGSGRGEGEGREGEGLREGV